MVHEVVVNLGLVHTDTYSSFCATGVVLLIVGAPKRHQIVTVQQVNLGRSTERMHKRMQAQKRATTVNDSPHLTTCIQL